MNFEASRAPENSDLIQLSIAIVSLFCTCNVGHKTTIKLPTNNTILYNCNPNDPQNLKITLFMSALPQKRNTQSSFPTLTTTHPQPPRNVPSLQNMFRVINRKNERKIDLVAPSRSSNKRRLIVMYDRSDYMVNMVDTFKYTQVHLSSFGSITHFVSRHIHILLDNELDRDTIFD